MKFLVSLIEVNDTKNHVARTHLSMNCTWVKGDYWLYEGEDWALDDGIDFDVIGKAAIENYGDLSGKQLVKMVVANYRVNLG